MTSSPLMPFRVIGLGLLVLLIVPSLSYPKNPEAEYKKIQNEMKEQKKRIRAAEKQESSLLSEIQEVNMKLGKIEAELGILKQKLHQTERKTSAVLNEISKSQQRLEKQKEWIMKKLRIMYKFGFPDDRFILLLNSKDIAQITRIYRYLESISLYEQKLLADFRRELEELENKNQRLKSLKAELLADRKKVKNKQNELNEKRKSRHLLLSSIRLKKAKYMKMLSELEAASKKLLEIIKESAEKDAYSATGFSRLRGKLAWPVSGEIALPYGSQKDPQFDTPVFRNGIHISTGSGKDVKSVFRGKIIFAEWFKGFGQLVIINHGSGYHTLYGNLSEIFSHVGDIIKDKQVIGKVGTSGILNAPGLYFEIRYKGKPLNPAQWLKKFGG